MTSQPRNRVVVFRLSQEEYRNLREASERAGARNLSDFARSELMARLKQAGTCSGRVELLELRVSMLQMQVENLLEGTSHASLVSGT